MSGQRKATGTEASLVAPGAESSASAESGIAPAILRAYPDLNDAQRQAIAAVEGPVLIIAGPGTGKTLVLVLRALNILLRGLAKPRELVVCTYTEKAALELRDRIAAAARKVEYREDLSELVVGTIHGICNDFIQRNRHRTPLRNNYEVLDELTELLFLFDHFDEVVGPEQNGQYLQRWSTKWTAIDGARRYFDKITEELLDPAELAVAGDAFVGAVARAYQAYERVLVEANRIDFAHLQKVCHAMLEDPQAGPKLLQRIRYVMVDEYQDTNYVQERLLAKFASGTGNLCVVGDEDQSLYRFRGATVRNILEFPVTFKECRSVRLTINYRSHPTIVAAYNKFMAGWDWSGEAGRPPHRFGKEIVPDPSARFAEYPAVFAIWGEKKKDEAARFADLVRFLRQNGVIEDYSQVALLLHSVRGDHSGPYLEALQAAGIPAFCPRARAYFENEEVRAMVGCLALIFGYHGDGRGGVQGAALQALGRYADECLGELARSYHDPHPLAKHLQASVSEIAALAGDQELNKRVADYFYGLLAYEPFAGYVKNENRARNLAIFSQLLGAFQNYYHYTNVGARNREPLRFHFFNSFLRLLHDGGINEYEDPDQPMPKGHVQVMTIHQSKGLEFPVVVVGSLDAQTSTPKQVDRILGPFYHRPPFEPENRVTGFDRMRLHYVAFSRAEKVLVLTATDPPQAHFDRIWQGLPQWPYVQKDLLKVLNFKLRARQVPKRTFGFTSDLRAYETCPRQYQFFHEYEFAPSRSAEVFFGTLVHQTVEDIHRRVLDGKLAEIDEPKVREWFDWNFRTLAAAGVRPIGAEAKKSAFRQVMSYFNQNRDEMSRVLQAEVDVSLEKEGYILVGKVDLVRGQDGQLELLDFKAQTRPAEGDPRIAGYHKQLCIYAHILQQRTGQQPVRLMIYWTGEEKREQALMVFPYRPEIVEAAVAEFEQVVALIRSKEFSVKRPPEKKVCKECDFRPHCLSEGTITLPPEEAN